MNDTPPAGPNSLGAQDPCATCSHARWRHGDRDFAQVDGGDIAPCSQRSDCACGGVFVEMAMSTRMARFVEAAQGVNTAVATMRDAMVATMHATAVLYGAMRHAGLLDTTGPCDGCSTVTDLVVTDDGRAQLCDPCRRIEANMALEAARRQTPALQRVNPTFHHVDCDDKSCDGTCTQGRSMADFVERQESPVPDGPVFGTHQIIPHAPGRGGIRYPHITPRTQNDLQGPVPDPEPHEHGPQCVRHGCPEAEVAAGIDMFASPPLTPLAEELYPAPIATSCATCWPRPCDPNGTGQRRSECQRPPAQP